MQDVMEVSPYIQKQRALYLEKNEWLDAHYERIEPHAFYREIFPVGSFEREGHLKDAKGNGIGITVTDEEKVADGAVNGSERRGNGVGMTVHPKGNVEKFIITDGLERLDELIGAEFAIMSPVSYFGRTRAGKYARYLYAITFDLDGVDMPQLRDTFHQMNRGFIPAATFVVNSGNGLHLYYVLESPVAMYPQNQKFLKELKYVLTRRIWNRFTSNIKEPQVQGVLQGFRVVGSGTKLGKDYPVVAYRYGKPVSLEYLLQYVPDTNGDMQRVTGILEKATMSIEEAKKKYPDWYERRVVRGERRGRWTVKRDLYDWWLRKIETEIHVGHRFYGIMTLAIYAVKCSIDEDELRRDADRLMKIFDEMSYEESNRFTVEDVVKALEMYNENFVTFPRADIAKYSGIPIPPNKRNWRKQEEHLLYIRGVRSVKQSMGDVVSGGGRPDKEHLVREYMIEHPEVRKKTEIAEALQINRHTVSKYYDAIRAEIDQQKRLEEPQRKLVVENGIYKIRLVPMGVLSERGFKPIEMTVGVDEEENAMHLQSE